MTGKTHSSVDKWNILLHYNFVLLWNTRNAKGICWNSLCTQSPLVSHSSRGPVQAGKLNLTQMKYEDLKIHVSNLKWKRMETFPNELNESKYFCEIVLSHCHFQWLNLFAMHFGRYLFSNKNGSYIETSISRKEKERE